MSQKERDVLKIMHAAVQGQRTQAEAARLLGKSIRQVRRLGFPWASARGRVETTVSTQF